MTALDQQIAAHIATYGVTRCPAAFAAPTSVELSAEDRQALQARAGAYAACRFGGGWVAQAVYEGRGR